MKFTKLKLSSVGDIHMRFIPIVTTDLFFNTGFHYEDVLKVETLLPQPPRATGVCHHIWLSKASLSQRKKKEKKNRWMLPTILTEAASL